MRLRARFFSIYYYTLYRCIFQQSFHTRQVFISSRFYKVIRVKLKCNFPLSSGVFPITVPPCKGTHGDRVAGDNTQHSHR